MSFKRKHHRQKRGVRMLSPEALGLLINMTTNPSVQYPASVIDQVIELRDWAKTELQKAQGAPPA